MCIFLILAGATVGIIVPAGLGWDFANFYDAGRRVAAGQISDLYSPQSLIGGRAPQGTLRFWGAPISAVLYAPLAQLSPESALVAFKLQNTIALFLALALLYLHLRRFVGAAPADQWRFATAFAFLCLIYQPFWTIYRVGGQTTPTVFLLLALALMCHYNQRFGWSALLLVLAVLIKPAFSLLLVPLLILTGIRFALGVAACLSVLGGVSLLLMGWDIHREFLSLMVRGLQTSYGWPYNSSLYVTAENMRLLVDPANPSSLSNIAIAGSILAVKLAVIGLFVYVFTKARSQRWTSPVRRHFEFLMAVAFCLMISQIVWEHYLSVLFFPLAYVVASHRHFSRRGLALVASVFVLAVGQNLVIVNFIRTHFTIDSFSTLLSIGLWKSGPLLLTLGFLMLHYKELFASYAAWSRTGLEVTHPPLAAIPA